MSSREAEVQPVGASSRTEARGIAPVAAAVAALLCLARIGLNGEGVISAFLAFVLVWLAAIDLRERILPNRIVVPATVGVLAAHALVTPHDALQYLVAAVVAGALFLVPALLRPGALGMGDVKLAMLLGAGLGSDVVPALTLGLVAAGLYAAALVFTRGRAAMKTEMPLGPFLAVGAILLLLA
jgi:leader peptidase (prepilin peptidase) / N-methyltransferase